jgi:hypothetical protein
MQTGTRPFDVFRIDVPPKQLGLRKRFRGGNKKGPKAASWFHNNVNGRPAFYEQVANLIGESWGRLEVAKLYF